MPYLYIPKWVSKSEVQSAENGTKEQVYYGTGWISKRYLRIIEDA